MIRGRHFACVTVLAGNEYRVSVVVVASAMTVAVTAAVTYILPRSTMSL